MFEKFKEAKQLQQLQAIIKKQRVDVEKNGVKMGMNGSMEVEYVKLDPEMSHEKLEKAVKECFNAATKELRKLIAQNVKM